MFWLQIKNKFHGIDSVSTPEGLKKPPSIRKAGWVMKLMKQFHVC